ncbi:beta strand repeat-containing protein [Hymenobacter cellulosilyticus]|uniref:Right-handed parallel beta-helix repeat-containing protein n=1 Tax=Hymenobacter cellulosilyticus TaxID=2932248 RepID=A0A8T9QAW5_9BACT|nr:right-handed parallel beta-helix repeat-containing protein [Hymenobacter cellulosilyticus]UOQ72013.1 right-handed parallel beta-helix repeat-containing protein [Hymenobacter cellulosilyticus]
MKHTLRLLGLLLPLGLCASSATAGTLSGRVFEDVNYGGGSGAPYSTTGGFVGRPARIEIYRSGTFVTAVTAAADGTWSYSYSTGNSTFVVRVVSGSVTSSRGTATNLIPVVTFRKRYTGNNPNSQVDDPNYVGGEDPTQADVGNTTSGSLNTGAQVQTTVTDADDNENFTNIDFGFSFDVVVNTNDAGQGSLRQFILNANALSNSAIDQRQFSNAGTATGTNFPAGQETSIFMISDGTARPGLRAGLDNQLTNASGAASTTSSRALITLASTLPTLTDPGTAIDGTTQTTLSNSNSVQLGTGGVVGTESKPLARVAGPEVELAVLGGTIGLTLNGNSMVVRGLSIHGGTYGVQADSGTNLLIEGNAFGTTAFSIAAPSANLTSNILLYLRNPSGTVRNNIFAHAGSSNLNYSGGFNDANSGYTITQNEFLQAGRTTAGGDNISVGDQAASGPLTITENLIRDSNSSGIQFEISAIRNNLVSNNTIQGNGKGGTSSRLEGSGIHYLLRADGRQSSNTDVISKNIISGNQSSAVVINYGQRNVQVTQNAIYGNGDGTTGGQGLIAIDYTPATYRVGGNSAYGQGDGVTPNDGTLDMNKANGGMNYPIITKKNVTTVGGNTVLHVEGFVGRTAGQTLFAGTVVEFYRGDNTTDTNQNGEVFAGDGQSFPHGEPSAYIGSLTTGADGSFNTDITFPTSAMSPALQTSDPINATAFKSGYGTSEAGINLIPNTIPPGTLPVSLVGFQAACVPAGVRLTWQTASEENNAGFEVQRSLDARSFTKISFVPGVGTTAQRQSYTLLTAAPGAATAYYRLRQLDLDGKESFSPVAVLACALTAPATLRLVPNPARDAVQVQNATGPVQVLDLTGRIVREQASTTQPST